MQKMVEKEMTNAILTAQRGEITEHFVYPKLSQSAMDPHNKTVGIILTYPFVRLRLWWKIRFLEPRKSKETHAINRTTEDRLSPSIFLHLCHLGAH